MTCRPHDPRCAAFGAWPVWPPLENDVHLATAAAVSVGPGRQAGVRGRIPVPEFG